MGSFALRRIGQGLFVVFAATIVVFALTRWFTDPVDFVLPLEATAEERALREAELGFDRPILVQFGDYLSDLARGDFGESLWQPGRCWWQSVARWHCFYWGWEPSSSCSTLFRLSISP